MDMKPVNLSTMVLNFEDDIQSLGEKTPTVSSLNNWANPIKCSECSHNFNGKEELEAHMVADHLQWMRYRCPYCEMMGMPTLRLIVKHQATAHRVKVAKNHGATMVKFVFSPQKEAQISAMLTRCLSMNNSIKRESHDSVQHQATQTYQFEQETEERKPMIIAANDSQSIQPEATNPGKWSQNDGLAEAEMPPRDDEAVAASTPTMDEDAIETTVESVSEAQPAVIHSADVTESDKLSPAKRSASEKLTDLASLTASDTVATRRRYFRKRNRSDTAEQEETTRDMNDREQPSPGMDQTWDTLLENGEGFEEDEQTPVSPCQQQEPRKDQFDQLVTGKISATVVKNEFQNCYSVVEFETGGSQIRWCDDRQFSFSARTLNDAKMVCDEHLSKFNQIGLYVPAKQKIRLFAGAIYGYAKVLLNEILTPLKPPIVFDRRILRRHNCSDLQQFIAQLPRPLSQCYEAATKHVLADLDLLSNVSFYKNQVLAFITQFNIAKQTTNDQLSVLKRALLIDQKNVSNALVRHFQKLNGVNVNAMARQRAKLRTGARRSDFSLVNLQITRRRK